MPTEGDNVVLEEQPVGGTFSDERTRNNKNSPSPKKGPLPLRNLDISALRASKMRENTTELAIMGTNPVHAEAPQNVPLNMRSPII